MMSDQALDTQHEEKQISLLQDAFVRLAANKLAVIGMLLVLLVFFIAIFGPYITPYDFLVQDLHARNQGPTLIHWFGTDDLGRDILSRVIYGARTAVIVAFSTVMFSLIIGLFMGALGGYFGGKIDAFVVWLIDITMSVPSLLLVIVINVSLKPPMVNWMDAQFMATGNEFYRNTIWVDFVLVFGSLALIKWPKAARIVRGQIMSIRNKNYVLAAEAIGVPTAKIVSRYVIPNSIGPVIVYISAALGEAMVLESSFSFLGVGVRPPIPSWGNMISDGLRVWQLYPHILAAPAAALAIVTIAFSFLGDGLNDALNPRQWK
jgi:ABC-type dipeptide/oligopeptide/nickel transport system permease subunit